MTSTNLSIPSSWRRNVFSICLRMIVFTLLLFVAAACSTEQPDEVAEPSNEVVEQSGETTAQLDEATADPAYPIVRGYPVPADDAVEPAENSVVESNSAETQATEINEPVATAAPSTEEGAQIIGHLAFLPNRWLEQDLTAYLAEYHDIDGGIFVLEPQLFPNVEVGADLSFHFTGLEPKDYVILVGPNEFQARVLLDAAIEQTMVFRLQDPNEVVYANPGMVIVE